MADFYPLIARAISSLSSKTPEARQAIYERVRTALDAHLREKDPPMSELEIAQQQRALAAAIHRVEDEASQERTQDPSGSEYEFEETEPLSVVKAPEAHIAPNRSPVSATKARRVARGIGGFLLFFAVNMLAGSIAGTFILYVVISSILGGRPPEGSVLDRALDLLGAVLFGYLGVVLGAFVLDKVMKDYPARGIGVAFVIWLLANYLLHFLFFPHSEIIPEYEINLGLHQSVVAVATAWYIFRLPPFPRRALKETRPDLLERGPAPKASPIRKRSLPPLQVRVLGDGGPVEKQPTLLDGLIKLAYGNSPPKKTAATLEQAIGLCYEMLLGRVVEIDEVRKIATQLYNGRMPYSTHDLAVATALNVFRNAVGARHEQLAQIQIFARITVIEWLNEKKVNPLLMKAFEDTLYKMFKPAMPQQQTKPKPSPIEQADQPTTRNAQSPPTVKELLMARAPPWDRVAPKVIDTILEAITDKGLFEAFVMHSMNEGLVARYEALGGEGDDPTVIRAQISHILCQTGNKAINSLASILKANQKDAWLNACVLATDTFEAAIALAKNQISGYIGMAHLYGLVGKPSESHEWAKRGLAEVDEMRRGFMESGIRPFQGSTIIPPDALDQAERQLRGYLER